jgi:hypothetical protein
MRPRLAPILLLPLLLAAVGCRSPLLDAPDKVRHTDTFLPPIYSSSSSEDGTSSQWSAAFWLVGKDVEADRRHMRVLPFYWHDSAPPYRDRTLYFPFYYTSDSAGETRRFYSFLFGQIDSPELHSDYVLLPLFYREYSKVSDSSRSGLMLIYDWRHEAGRTDFTFLPFLGLAPMLRMSTGLPADGETVPANGRESSRRIELVNILGLVSLFGYDDIGDRREVRFLTLFSSEVISLFRSWRSRGDDPFVREWLFPLYMNLQDEDDGWYYVGPLWGGISDRVNQRETSWWGAGLVSHTEAPEGDTWRIAGIPISSP